MEIEARNWQTDLGMRNFLREETKLQVAAQGFKELAMTARQFCCHAVLLIRCNLTTEKLLKFEEGCGGDKFKVLTDENYF